MSRFKRLCDRIRQGMVLKGKKAKEHRGPRHRPDFAHFEGGRGERRKLKPK